MNIQQADNVLYGDLGTIAPSRTTAGDERRLVEGMMPITCRILLSIAACRTNSCPYADLEQMRAWMRERSLLGDNPHYPDASFLLFCLRQRQDELFARHPEEELWCLTPRGEHQLGLVRKYRPEQEWDHPGHTETARTVELLSEAAVEGRSR